MAAKLKSPQGAINACRDILYTPDRKPISPRLAYTLLVLATHYPHIRPTQKQLASELKIAERNVRERLSDLESTGLIRRTPGRSHKATVYRLDLELIRDLGENAVADDW